jgi:uncharacterized protein YeaO (DUF488 family)
MPVGFVVKRVYEPPASADGYRVLVDRLWPRGLAKEDAALNAWLKELAPSAVLRRWYAHELSRWDGFRHRYAAELDAVPQHWQPLAHKATRQRVTLLYGARDEACNNAVALKAYLEAWLHTHGPR